MKPLILGCVAAFIFAGCDAPPPTSVPSPSPTPTPKVKEETLLDIFPLDKWCKEHYADAIGFMAWPNNERQTWTVKMQDAVAKAGSSRFFIAASDVDLMRRARDGTLHLLFEATFLDRRALDLQCTEEQAKVLLDMEYGYRVSLVFNITSLTVKRQTIYENVDVDVEDKSNSGEYFQPEDKLTRVFNGILVDLNVPSEQEMHTDK